MGAADGDPDMARFFPLGLRRRRRHGLAGGAHRQSSGVMQPFGQIQQGVIAAGQGKQRDAERQAARIEPPGTATAARHIRFMKLV